MKQLFVLFVGLLFFLRVEAACDVIDDAGKPVHVQQPAQRIISLAPDLTENLFAVGAGKQIVGVMQGSDYPVEAKRIPVVANYQAVDLEKLYALNPDLIVVWGEGKLAQSLRQLNIPIYVSHPKKILDVPATLQRLGCLTGKEKQGAEVVADYLRHYHALEKRYAAKQKVSVFYQVWQQPLITISDASWIHDVITVCGGKNSFGQLKGSAPEVNLEAVLVANPAVILGAQSQSNWQAFWEKWPDLSAVKNKHLYRIDADLIERASPRLLHGMDQVCKRLDAARQKSHS